MRIIGHGIDIVEVCRVERFLRTREDHWAEGVFSAVEREQADEPPRDTQYYAGRFAAKEAVSKALGTGFSGDVTVHGINILRISTGEPEVKLSGEVLATAIALGITRWFISISHSGGLAMASVIAVGD
jgi:holo-[acyl-carrier protein] synthase